MAKQLLVITLLSLACLIAAPVLFSAQRGEQAGKVLAVKGKVSVVRDAEASSVLNVDSPVFVNDKIQTAENSRVKLLMSDESILTLGRKAEMVIQEYNYRPNENKRSSVLKLNSGNLRSLVSKFFSGFGSKFEVHTRTAVAGARGTVNLTSVINDKKTLVVGLEADTDVFNNDTSVHGKHSLTGRLGSYVSEGEPPTEPFLVGDDILGPLLDDTNFSRAPEFRPEDTETEFPYIKPDEGATGGTPQTPPIDQQPPGATPPPPPPSPPSSYGNYIYINNLVDPHSKGGT